MYSSNFLICICTRLHYKTSKPTLKYTQNYEFQICYLKLAFEKIFTLNSLIYTIDNLDKFAKTHIMHLTFSFA